MEKLAGNTILWIAGVVLVGLLVFAGYWVLTEPGRQKGKANVAVAGQATAKGDAAASAAATGAVSDQADRAADQEKLSQENRDDILHQPGASLPTDPGVNDAKLRSLCKRPAYRGSGRCVRLLGPNPAKVPG